METEVKRPGGLEGVFKRADGSAPTEPVTLLSNENGNPVFRDAAYQTVFPQGPFRFNPVENQPNIFSAPAPGVPRLTLEERVIDIQKTVHAIARNLKLE